MNKTISRDERKAARQALVLDVVAQESVATQEELVAAVRRRGMSATQVSMSRDIAELGLIKAGGRYRLGTPETGAADPQMPLRVWVKAVETAGDHLVVVRCDAGTAQRVGLVIDGLSIAGIAGTLAGDDAVFVATKTAAASKSIVQFLRSRIHPHETP